MQIKIIMMYHFRPVRMAIIIKSTNYKCRRGCREKGTLILYYYNNNGEQYGGSLKKLKLKLPYDPVILVLGI